MKNMMPLQMKIRARLPARTRPQVLLRRPSAFVSQEFLDASYFAGKYLTLFVFFYSSLNFLYYRNLRQDEEDDD